MYSAGHAVYSANITRHPSRYIIDGKTRKGRQGATIVLPEDAEKVTPR